MKKSSKRVKRVRKYSKMNLLHPKTIRLYEKLYGGRYYDWIFRKLRDRWLAGRPTVLITPDYEVFK